MKRNKRKKNQDGWTFMETLIVIAIIAILAATVGFTAIKSLEKARRASTLTQIDSFTAALEAYYIDCGFYPTEEQGLSALRTKPTSPPVSDSWAGPYVLKNIPRDPWGNEYEYTSPAEDGSDYGIRSFGADGKIGGDGKNADIKSWSDN